MRVSQVMSSPALAVTPGTTVLDAVRYLLQRDVVTLPVVGNDRELLGVVSRSDLLRHSLFADPARPMVAATPDAAQPAATVVDVMTRRVVTVSPATDVGEAADVLGRHRIRAVPVVDGGRLVGLVRVRDLLQAPTRGQLAGPLVDRDDDPRTPPRAVAPSSSGRPTDRRGLTVLSLDECLERLRSTPVGRFAFVVRGAPVVLPVNHGLDGTTIVFRATWGSKLQVAQATGPVAYEVDGLDTATRSGWSVLVQGVAQTAYDEVDIERYERLGVPIWAPADGDMVWVRLRPDDISGRELTGPA
jgi:CBS domain-containing protein